MKAALLVVTPMPTRQVAEVVQVLSSAFQAGAADTLMGEDVGGLGGRARAYAGARPRRADDGPGLGDALVAAFVAGAHYVAQQVRRAP